MHSTFIQVKGNEFVQSGKSIRLRGFGIGSWLNLEHFMLGIPTPDQMIRKAFQEVYGEADANQFFIQFAETFVQDDDLELLKQMGINFIRVPFNYRLLLDDQNRHVFREEGFQQLSRLLKGCERHGIYLMLDLHTAPGGQNPDWHSDNVTGVAQFWEYDVFRSQIVTLWREIARRFSHEPYLMGYDLINEPFMIPDPEHLNRFYKECIASIREVDPYHVIVVEGDQFAMDFSRLAHFDEEQLALSFHYYPTVWTPTLLEKSFGRAERIAEFKRGLAKLVAIREKFGRPVICGEAGYDLHPEDMPFCMELLQDTLALFEDFKLSWTLWTYKDACFMGIVHPDENSLWMQFADEVKSKWTHYGEMKQAGEVMDRLGAEFPGTLSDALKYKLQFRVRGILYEMQKEMILKPILRAWPWERMQQLPDSFLLKNCAVHEAYESLMHKVLK